jgi:hypothetical protein
MGYTYQATQSPFGGTDLSGITLLTETAMHQYRDVLVPRSPERPVIVSLFGYDIFQNVIGKESRATSSDSMQQHSLLAWRIAHGSLPSFRLFTRGTFGNMGMPVDSRAFPILARGKTGGMDLGSPAFAERYVLVADDETAVRMLFTPFLVNALVQQPPRTWLHIQVSPDWLLFYDPAIFILRPEQIAPALARLTPIADQLLGRTPAAA